MSGTTVLTGILSAKTAGITRKQLKKYMERMQVLLQRTALTDKTAIVLQDDSRLQLIFRWEGNRDYYLNPATRYFSEKIAFLYSESAKYGIRLTGTVELLTKNNRGGVRQVVTAKKAGTFSRSGERVTSRTKWAGPEEPVIIKSLLDF